MKVEWDEGKRVANFRKHGVDFADAVGALLDPYCLTRDDPGSRGEPRYVTLGRGFSDRVLLVVWTERAGDATRIISARKASAGEARSYED